MLTTAHLCRRAALTPSQTCVLFLNTKTEASHETLMEVLKETMANDNSLFSYQTKFTKMLPLLLNKAFELGYDVTLGDAFRDPRVFGPLGIKLGYGEVNSNHKQRLAIDLNLFKNGVFLQSTEDHKPLGEYWESIGGTWGGRFNDGNHYSLTYNGMK